MNGYDQWKTASPNEDFDDACPRCGADYNNLDMPEYTPEQEETEWHTDGFCSQECFDEYATDINHDGIGIPRWKRITAEQREQLEALRKRAITAMEIRRADAKATPVTIEQIFENAPDGNFKWDGIEAGDWHVYNCGEKDCTIGWHKVAYGQNFSRENHKLCIELWSVDESGPTGDLDVWESGDDPHDVCFAMSISLWEYFQGWFQYWSDCAETGQDVLNDADDTHKNVGAFIKFAEDNVKSLEK